jgi:hypothetical protein
MVLIIGLDASFDNMYGRKKYERKKTKLVVKGKAIP